MRRGDATGECKNRRIGRGIDDLLSHDERQVRQKRATIKKLYAEVERLGRLEELRRNATKGKKRRG